MSKALLLVDIQNDYFPGGRMELVDMDAAAANAARVLAAFREADNPVCHVQHLSLRPGATFFLPDTHGAELHDSVTPQGDEPLIRKHFPNAFRDTSLQRVLEQLPVTELVICGAMSHMCIDSTTRAAFDLGFRCALIEDACATRDLQLNGRTVVAADVHAAFMAALSSPYARVVSAAALLAEQ